MSEIYFQLIIFIKVKTSLKTSSQILSQNGPVQNPPCQAPGSKLRTLTGASKKTVPLTRTAQAGVLLQAATGTEVQSYLVLSLDLEIIVSPTLCVF